MSTGLGNALARCGVAGRFVGMEPVRYQLRHVDSGCVAGDERGAFVFCSAADAGRFATRFVCEPGAFVVEPLAVAAPDAA